MGDMAGTSMTRSRRIGLSLLSTCLLVHATWAQLGPVQLPELPRIGLPPVSTVNDIGHDLEQVLRAEVRQLRVRELLRTQSALLERDPNGNAILRAQIVALSPSAEALAAARGLGFTVVREQQLEGLDARLLILHAPERWTTRRALRQLRALDPLGTYDFDHLYWDSGSEAASASSNPPATTVPLTASATANEHAIRVGLIDGGIDLAHPVFQTAHVHTYGCDGRPVASAHGTAVASLLVGNSALFSGAVPTAELYAADVYCGLAIGGTVEQIIDALAWVTRAQAPVINLSLVGPPNRALEFVVKVVVARGYLVVAAVGNDGPAAPPLYPAAYPGVIAVTGVDVKRRVLLEASRNPQLRFTAPGADMVAAALSGLFVSVRGTSFAAPIVAGLLVRSIEQPGTSAAAAALDSLAKQAVDLGAPGFDAVTGYGLVGEALRVRPIAALLAKPADVKAP